MNLNRKYFEPLIKYLKPYKKAIYITSIFVILENVVRLFSPLIYGKAIDHVINEKSIGSYAIQLMVFWALINISRSWFYRIKMKKSNIIANLVSRDILVQCVEHLVKLPLSFHKSKKIGEIIQRFSRADQYIYRFVEDGIFYIVPNLITSFLAFVVIFWIRWEISFIYLFFLTIYFFVTLKRTDPIIKFQKKLNKIWEKIYGDIFDRTPNIITIKSNSTEKIENSRNMDNFEKGLGLFNEQITLWANLTFWQNLIFTLAFLSLFGSGIYFVNSNKITIGEFVILLAYITMASSSFGMLGNYYKQLQEGLVTIRRANKIFNEIPEEYDNPEAIDIKNCKGEVEFKNVSFSYEKENVLENISFKAEAGKMVAIVGKSGEGKTTLVDLISRYISPVKGAVILDGTDIQKIKLKSLRNQIAIVPQEIDLFNDTIRNNIAYSKLSASLKEVIYTAKLAHCDEFIEKFDNKYEQVVGEKGVKLSTGQKQRVAIARAILRNPKILILDEATSALDSESEKYVQKALEEVMKNRTTFVIAHRLSTIRKADLIIVIENGKLVESGDHKELINKGGVYKKLSELQNISV